MSVLEQLQKKNEPIEFEGVQILLPGQIEITTKVELKVDSEHDAIKFRENIKKRKQVRPVSELSLLDPEEKEPPKIKRRVSKIKRKKPIILGEVEEKPAKKTKKTSDQLGLIHELSEEDVYINDEPIEERLPERKKVPDITKKGPAYYLSNKQVFSKFINQVFKKYEKELDGKNPVTCEALEEKKKGVFSLLIHQKIIEEYMNVYSPYRGLLLYHGLGAGKTCASIAIAEGLKYNKKIVIMTPKSLQKNYIEELKVCGDPLWRLNQHWEWIPYSKLNQIQLKELSALLQLNIDIGNRGDWTMKKNKGLYLVNTKKKPNYEEMNNNEKQKLNKQIEAQIMYKYQFIAYNGLRQARLAAEETVAYSESNGQTRNPFSNKVVIIDEAHNLISRIVNKLPKTESAELDNSILSLKLYKYLKNATNCRIVFLTGTPIINYPNEIGVLFNILRGNINTFKFKIIQRGSKLTAEDIKKILSSIGVEDYISYKGSKGGFDNELQITRNPFNFVNYKKDQKIFDIANQMDDELFKKMIIDNLEKNNVGAKFIDTDHNTVLPDTIDVFKKTFIDSSQTKNKGKLINPIKFKRRILGLTSYFRSASEQLLPKKGPIREIKIPMSLHQLGIYEKARESERKESKRNAKKRMVDVHAETSSSYRIFSRLFCNFVFPEGLERPMPDKFKTLDDAIKSDKVDEDLIDNTDINERIEKDGSVFDKDDEKKIEIAENSYQSRIDESITKLKEGIVIEETGKRIMPLKVNGTLNICSPKFFKLYQILRDNPDGSHLIYSQFRSLEGIELIKTILEENGYAHFDIKKDAEDQWKLNIKEEDIGKKMFCLYTGKENADKKEIIRNIFNSDWNKIDINLATELRKIHDNNFRGEIVQIMMITSSGAEGINLKNVRHVHLIEPYWHPVRTEQVIGRARRICSHQDLPERDRNISIYLYLMTLDEDLLAKASDDLTKNDKSKIEYGSGKNKKFNIFTTDESLWEIAQIKQLTNKSILTAIKESSIDCKIHSKSSGENLKCFQFNTQDTSKWAYNPNWNDLDEDDKTFKDQRVEIKFKWKVFKHPGKADTSYAMTNNTDKSKPDVLKDLYDLDDARKNIVNHVGVIVKVQGKAQIKLNQFQN